MKNLGIICLGIFALCVVGCSSGGGNKPAAPTTVVGLTYDVEVMKENGIEESWYSIAFSRTGVAGTGVAGTEIAGTNPVEYEEYTAYTYEYSITGSGSNLFTGATTGNYTYTNARNWGRVNLVDGSGSDIFSLLFTHELQYLQNDHNFLTTGIRFSGSYSAEHDSKPRIGTFIVSDTPEAGSLIAPLIAPVSAN